MELALVLQDIIDAINYRMETVKSSPFDDNTTIIGDINEGLVALADALFLIAKFEVDPWEESVDTKPAPTDVLEFHKYALWRDSGSQTYQRLKRVAVDSFDTGWYYDGQNIGLLNFPRSDDGTFAVWYFRQPTLFAVSGDENKAPEGGDMVAHALIQYGIMCAYERMGDEVSAQLAERFRRSFEVAKATIYATRKRLVSTLPTKVTVGELS